MKLSHNSSLIFEIAYKSARPNNTRLSQWNSRNDTGWEAQTAVSHAFRHSQTLGVQIICNSFVEENIQPIKTHHSSIKQDWVMIIITTRSCQLECACPSLFLPFCFRTELFCRAWPNIGYQSYEHDQIQGAASGWSCSRMRGMTRLDALCLVLLSVSNLIGWAGLSTGDIIGRAMLFRGVIRSMFVFLDE